MKRGLVLLLVLLTGCGGHEDHAPPPRPIGSRPSAPSLPTNRETRACLADLSRADIMFNTLPDRDYGGGCQLAGTVQLLDIGVPVTNLKAMRCGLADSFAGWVSHAVAPAAYQILGSELVRVESMGSYACRNVVGVSGVEKRSGHATANAVDISGFVLQDGRRITIEQGWRSPDPRIQAFFRTIHRSACKRFGTVLSPDYNAAHYNHFHLEDDHKDFCR